MNVATRIFPECDYPERDSTLWPAFEMSRRVEKDQHQRDTAAIKQIIASLPPGLVTDLIWGSYSVGLHFLRQLLGGSWVEKHISGKGAKNEFFRVPPSDPQRMFQHLSRVAELGEMALNLRFVPGFESVLQKLRDDNPESAFAELKTGELLYCCGVPFHFREPTFEIGKDYDLVVTVSGERACADTKCKIEATKPTVRTVVGSLRAASKQMPCDEPGLVFVSIPSVWFADEGPGNPDLKGERSQHAFTIMKAATDEFFRGTKRTVAVVFYTSLVFAEPGLDNDANLMILQPYANPAHRFDKSILWAQVLNDYSPYERGWLRVMTILDEGKGTWGEIDGKPMYFPSPQN